MAATFAWCFDHGMLHQFNAEPWCTATWVPFAVSTTEQALEAKAAAYGEAQFFDQLTSDHQLEIIEIRAVRDRGAAREVCGFVLAVGDDSEICVLPPHGGDVNHQHDPSAGFESADAHCCDNCQGDEPETCLYNGETEN